MRNSPRGSQWRKWDLHVHTPHSILNNQFGDNFDNYVQKLFKAALELNVEAIGLTDYCLVDGYKQVVNDYLHNDSKLAELFSDEEIRRIKKIAVFPNLEFRLNRLVIGKEVDLKWNRRTNFHVLLSDSLAPSLIENDFLSRIEFEFQAEPGRHPETRTLTRANLLAYGEQLIAQHPKFRGESPLAVGICNASVDSGKIASLLHDDARFRKNYLLALPCDEDLSEVGWNTAGHGQRKTLIQQSQLIFSSNPKTRAFLLGDYHETTEKFKSEFGQPKACIWGSDAHQYETLFRPDDNRLTWIKADLTFEGLKQVVFEPQSRVAIQGTQPEQKVDYEVIDSVKFIDTSGKNLFQELPIHFNPGLNSIIGGKSSGKSLLLYHIAQTANRDETEKKRQLATASDYSDFGNDPNLNFEVNWRDGSLQILKNTTETRPITYIPQLYINKLAEESGRAQLNELVLEIIYQDELVKSQADDFYQEIDHINEKISTNVSKLISHRQQYLKAKKDRDNIGNSKSIQQEIDRIKKEIEKIQKSAGFTAEENERYRMLLNRLSVIERRRTALILFVEEIQELEKRLISEISSAISSVELLDNQDTRMGKPLSVAGRLISEVTTRYAEIRSEITSHVAKSKKRAGDLIIKLESQEVHTSSRLKEFSKKVKSQNELTEQQSKLKNEERKLKTINEANRTVKSIYEQGKAIGEQLRASYENLFSRYVGLESLFNEAANIDNEHIQLKANLDFDHDRFDSFINCFDGRGSLSNLLGSAIDSENRYSFDKEIHLKSIFSIEERIRDFAKVETKVKKSADEGAILRSLLQDCFLISFDLLYKDDDIISMSPGKRGLVLLHLIVHLSNSSHPILIDQPEDNLDNRTVYIELRDFIRERKVKRQIIMVTHNANMVVSTDSECVIVANQAGQQHDMENERYRFEYISGAMEYTSHNPNAPSLLKKFGIREHICEVLEGGQLAFEERERKYAFRG